MENFKNKLLALLLLLLAVLSPGSRSEGTAITCCAGASGTNYTTTAITIRSRLWELLGGGSEAASADDAEVRPVIIAANARGQNGERASLIPGGMVFGTRLTEAHLTVTDAADCKGLMAGDKIISVSGKEVSHIRELSEILKACQGNAVEIVCDRGGKRTTVSITPKLVGDEYKLGAVLREGAAGIGTVTYIDPQSGEFGGLGHGICESGSARPIEMTGGTITDVVLGAVQKGESGKPGELTGILTDRTRGVIYSNTDVGVFGKYAEMPKKLDTPLPIAYKNEVKRGEATILSTLKNGKRMEYKIEIYDIDTLSNNSKSFKIRVDDPTLLAISGGIVRGMSGSPIIQNGKLVGAVTHVMINNPTEGYGIFIENMLNAAENTVPKAA